LDLASFGTTRVPCKFAGKQAEIVLDQIRTVDQSRLIKELGRIDASTTKRVLSVIQEMFA